MSVLNKKWSEAQLFARRKEVLAGWRTGAEVDLDEAIAYHKGLPPEKDYNQVLAKAKKEGRIIITVTIGHALVEEVIRDMRLCSEAGAESAYMPGGAYTRLGRYDMTERAVEQSLKAGGSLLHEYPIVVHGVKGMRRIVEDPRALCIAGQGYGQECARNAAGLQTEIALAGGVKNSACHDFHDLVQHCRNYSLEDRIEGNQYVARLLAYYEEHGVSMAACLWGNGTGWAVPSNLIAMQMMQALMAAEQGVKNLVLELPGQGNLIQDVAAWRALPELTKEYLERFGYCDVNLSVAGRPWEGAWPRDEYRAAGVAAMFAVEAALAPVDDIYIKSVREAVTTAMEEANPKAVRVTKQVLYAMKRQRLPNSPELALEQEMTKKEVRAIVDRVLELGDGDPLKGEVKAVEEGVLDISFPAWIFAKGKVVPIRDANGAMRYFRHGNLPFTKEIISYHQEKIREREKITGIEADMRMVADDITHFSREEI